MRHSLVVRSNSYRLGAYIAEATRSIVDNFFSKRATILEARTDNLDPRSAPAPRGENTSEVSSSRGSGSANVVDDTLPPHYFTNLLLTSGATPITDRIV